MEMRSIGGPRGNVPHFFPPFPFETHVERENVSSWPSSNSISRPFPRQRSARARETCLLDDI